LCRFIKGIHKFGTILSLIGAGKFLFGFFYRFIGDKKFGQQNCIALSDFFLKKFRICIALNDTFLSIAAHHWSYMI
jgi:hypothetical protein